MLIGLAYAWDARGGPSGAFAIPDGSPSPRWSPLQQLGRSSLFIYWIHVEMVYGLISLRIHKGLSAPQAWGAFAAFSLFMLACAVARERFLAHRAGKVRNASQPVYAIPR
jgi:uncharacterized membrane protein